jgi:hypothetical protein
MRRWIAVLWHLSFSAIAAALYFFFVLPRWYELIGDTSHTLGTALRIVAGALIGLAALPVVFTLLRTRRPEFGTPQLALTLRTTSIALHVVAAVLIIGTAVSEIWLSLDSAGSWLFGIYGAAAAIALLGISAFYLAFIAELPPPPPKPLKPKKARRGRRRKAAGVSEEATAEDDTADESVDDDEKPAEVTADPAEAAEADDATDADDADDEPQSSAQDEEPTNGSASGGLRNRRRRRLRGRVAVEDKS